MNEILNEILSVPLVPLLLLSGLFFGILLVVGVILAWLFDSYRRRLPEAVMLPDLQGRVQSERETLADLEKQVAEKRGTLSDLEQNQAEADFWEDRVKHVKEEWEQLDDRRAEIEEVRKEVQTEIENRAVAARKAEEKRTELADIEARLDAAQRIIAGAEAAQAGRSADLAAVTEQIEQAREERDQVREERDQARQVIKEATEAQASLADAGQRLEATEHAISDLEARRDALQTEIEDLEPSAGEADALKERIRSRNDRLAEIESEIRRAERQRDGAERELEAIQRKIEETRPASGGSPDPESVYGELLEAPACLTQANRQEARYAEDELEALDSARQFLEGHGLRFGRRMIKAFHTSLKINDISPITVLAGISGTGKSQLPRRYAEAMGMHYLQVPVQPRWDSPQDLMGFYNYMEGRYRATDLARALVHFDDRNWPDQSGGWADRVLLVLLDEMNLARVEYYFSEFLSRLEMRPADDEGADDNVRSDAEIAIDIPGLGADRQTLRVYPSRRILFAGTMNEDESTQSLSDKVLDRANMLRFPKPRKLFDQSDTLAGPPQDRFLSWQQWKRWTHGAEPRPGLDRKAVRESVEQINEICASVGRAFGHRMQQAISAYVANYPAEGPPDWKVALADQVEMRILPKLRGLDVEPSQQKLDKLSRFTRDTLNDEELAEAIRQAIATARSADGLFIWPGLQRDD